MATVTLTDPVNGNLADATLIANNNTILENVLNGNLDSGNLANNSVGTSELQDLSVTTPKLADGAVTTAKLAAGAVTADKLGAGALPIGTGQRFFGAGTPTGVVSGDLWYYPCASVGSPGVWTFLYRPEFDATYPWHFVGGAPMRFAGSPGYNGTGSMSWVQTPSFCPGPTLSWAGVFHFHWTVSMVSTYSGSGSALWMTGVSLGGATPYLDTAGYQQGYSGAQAVQQQAGSVALQLVSSGLSARVAYWSDIGFHLNCCDFFITPERIG